MVYPILPWASRFPREHSIKLEYQITAAKTVSPVIQGVPALVTFDALSSQAQIDSFLGTTNEFLLAAFDATAMGTDAFGGVVNMEGQVDAALVMEAFVYTGTANVTVTGEAHPLAVAAMTASSLTTQYAKGANGNLAFRIIVTGLDALTSGLIQVKLSWVSK